MAGKDIEDILATEWSTRFEADVLGGVGPTAAQRRFLDRCRDAMVVSFFKYGALADGFGVGRPVSAIETMPEKLALYVDGGVVRGRQRRAGNAHWLEDVYNYAMIESMYPTRALMRNTRPGPTQPHRRPEQIAAAMAQFGRAPGYGKLVEIGRLAMAEACDPEHMTAHYEGVDGSNGRATTEGFTDRPNVVSRVKEFR